MRARCVALRRCLISLPLTFTGSFLGYKVTVTAVTRPLPPPARHCCRHSPTATAAVRPRLRPPALGAQAPAATPPVRTNDIPRQIPEQQWYMGLPFTMLVGGILPFGAVFIELFFIMTSVW